MTIILPKISLSQDKDKSNPTPTSRFIAQSSADMAAYFCNSFIRGQSDLITFDQKLAKVSFSGNITLQTNFVEITASNLSVFTNKQGFNTFGNAALNKSVQVIVYDDRQRTLSNVNCDKGLIKNSSKLIPLYKINTQILEWNSYLDKEEMKMRGHSVFEVSSLEISLIGDSIDVVLDKDGQAAKIRLSDRFEMSHGNEVVFADQALIDLAKNRVVAIGEVTVSLGGITLITAERLEMKIDDTIKVIIDKDASNPFFIR
ncbi:MAG: hypothetical protein JJV97_05400 [SAR324 cluster bacterium]|nr:hypothetical protein [SAR324 cluster bacterium]